MQGDPLFLKRYIFIGVLKSIFLSRPQDYSFPGPRWTFMAASYPSRPGPVAVMGVVDLSRNEILDRHIRNARWHTRVQPHIGQLSTSRASNGLLVVHDDMHAASTGCHS